MFYLLNAFHKLILKYRFHIVLPITDPSYKPCMYYNFGQKVAKLHHGPMWSVASAFHVSHEHERPTMSVLLIIDSLILLLLII